MREITALVSFISFITLLILSIRLYLEKSRKSEHLLFNLFTLLLSVISFSEFMVHLAGNLKDAFFWARVASLWPLASGVFLHFVMKISCKNKNLVKAVLPIIYAGSITMVILYNSFIHTGGAVHQIAGYSLSTPTVGIFPAFLVVPMQNLYLITAFALLLRRSVSPKKKSSPGPRTHWILLSFSLLLITTGLSYAGTVLLSMPEIVSLPYLVFAGCIFLGIKKGHLIILTPKTTLEHILTKLQEMVILTSPTGRILSVNMAVEEYFGVRNESVLGKPVQQLLENAPDDGEFRITDTSGRERWLKVVVSNVHDPRGKKSGTVYVVRDITQEKMYTQSLQQSVQEKDALLHELHHRVNNSLQIVASLLNLKSDSMESSKDREILQLCGNRVRLISFIYELAYSRDDLSHIPLKTVLQELSSDLYQQYSNRREIEITQDLDQVYVDLQMAIPVALVITELFSNVFEHAYNNQTKGIIDLRLKESTRNGADSGLIIQVQDQGKGFDTDAATFHGLALAKALCSQINAELRIESGEKGTQVIIDIPGTTAA